MDFLYFETAVETNFLGLFWFIFKF